MKKLLVILLLSSAAFGQRIKTADVLRAGDSLIAAAVGKELAGYFSVTTAHSDHPRKHFTNHRSFLRKRRLHRDPTQINVLYHFIYPNIPGVRGGIWLRFDNNLQLTEPLEFDFIPDFLLHGGPSNFIGTDAAMVIIKEAFPTNVPIEGHQLQFDSKRHVYTYTAMRIITKTTNAFGRPAGEMESITLDAVTGKILKRFMGYYGVIIR